jgi:hypothetical protein
VLTQVIAEGSHAFEQHAKAAGRAGSALEAAKRQGGTLAGQMKELGKGVTTLAEDFGRFLIPKLTATVNAVRSVVDWFKRHKEIAILLGGVIAGPLTLAIGTFITTKIAGFIRGLGGVPNVWG